MSVIDISGRVYNGMWTYGGAYPQFKVATVGFPFGGEVYPVDVFEGLHAQTGTYVESPAIAASGKGQKLNDLSIDRLYRIEAYVLKVPRATLREKDGRPFITREDLERAAPKPMSPGAAILVSTGYGVNWDRTDYVEKSWFFSREALYYLIDQKPLLVGGDSPVWENAVHPEGAFERFYKSGIFLLAPCINLEKINSFKVKLIVLPLKIVEAGICPVRAVAIEE